ncbi:Gfo/Idh/MocA family protein [Chengkuizengella sediminis]|uniref:Gfo/Idh/MocA family protein n=1 Tax=Chengkuizengella sediminis TaxID=1885917 RepID=UPI0013894CD0|nr:Gfo/Idh/MocA family oxidoreductase [Chengkuizengella sediminis]NDI35967.1 Gfo/Idh/MocA family oxidoreductase [Chengkuizengella sediminis]
MIQKLKVGVIGTGAIAQNRHIPEYKKNRVVELVGVVDINLSRAKEVADQFNIQHYYQSTKDLIEHHDLDIISICTPNHTHTEIAKACLNKGIHVLCEKPLSTHYKDALALNKLAEEKNVYLAVGLNQRLVPAHQKIKEILDHGDFGKVYQIKASFGHSGPEHWSVEGEKNWFFDREKSFFGSLGDLGIHKIDLIRWFLNEEITEVSSLKSTIEKPTNVDDNAIVIMKTEGDTLCTVTTSWTYTPWVHNELMISCEFGTLLLEQNPDKPGLTILKKNMEETVEVDWLMKEKSGYCHSGLINYFVNSVMSKTEPTFISAKTFLGTLKATFAAEQSAKTKQTVCIND